MRFPKLFLQALLALGLVLNGPGIALTGLHAGMADAVASVRAGQLHQVATGQQAGPCHDSPPAHGHAGGAAAAHDADDAAASHPQGSPDASPESAANGSDCCGDASTCRCACVHGTMASIGIAFARAEIPLRQTASRPLSSGHAEPTRAALIRPPIG